MGTEILSFSKGIGATLLKNIEDIKLKRNNYFKKNDKIFIVKISRSAKPFYGVDADIINRLNNLSKDYYLVLLVSKKEGWLYSKSEVKSKIQDGDWRLRKADNNYKINYGTLSASNRFASYEEFMKKLS